MDNSMLNLGLLCLAYCLGFATLSTTLTSTATVTRDILIASGDSASMATVPIGFQVFFFIYSSFSPVLTSSLPQQFGGSSLGSFIISSLMKQLGGKVTPPANDDPW